MVDRTGHNDQRFAGDSSRDDGLGTSAAERWLRDLDAAADAGDGPDVDTIKLRARVEILERWFAETASVHDEGVRVEELEARVTRAIRNEVGIATVREGTGLLRNSGASQLLRWGIPTALAASIGVALLLTSARRESAELSTQYVDAFLRAGDFDGEVFATDFELGGLSVVGEIEDELAAIEVAGLDLSRATIDDSIEDLDDELGTLDALRGDSLFQFELGGETGA